MVVYLALLIPILVTIVFYYFKKHEFVWWEFFVPFFAVLVCIVISKLIIDTASVTFTEYWGSTVTSVYEEEPYNYWDVETCSESYPCGTDKDGRTTYCTRTYDCSHQDDVGPNWRAETNLGEEFNIYEKEHDNTVKLFQTQKIPIESRNNYDSDDKCISSSGTKFEGKAVGQTSYVYQTTWNKSEDTRKAYTSEHSYENRIKASDLTIFNIKLVTDEQADSLDLYEYPSYSDGFLYPTILGGNVPDVIQEKFKRLNGKFGVSNKLRLWILIFENKPSSIANYQENYWVKGNKNELVICIGTKGNQIQWSHAFSWAKSEVLTAEVKQRVMNLYTYKDSLIKRNLPPAIPVNDKMKLSKTKLKVLPVPTQLSDTIIRVKSPYPMLTNETLDDFYNYLNRNLGRFEKRSFKEFDYLTVEPSNGALIFIYIFALLISIGVNLWVVNNEVSKDNPTINNFFIQK